MRAVTDMMSIQAATEMVQTPNAEGKGAFGKYHEEDSPILHEYTTPWTRTGTQT